MRAASCGGPAPEADGGVLPPPFRITAAVRV